jgi:hypothetical protein
MPDNWEVANELNPSNSSDAYGDPDGDGIQNQYEYVLGFNPHLATTSGSPDSTKDRDGDGMKDLQEAATGSFKWNSALQRNIFVKVLNWEVADAHGDYDQDGLTNIQELELGSNLNSADSDGDGSSDKEELEFGTNSNSRDSDDDGVLDGIEIRDKTNPNSSSSHGPVIKTVDRNLSITFSSRNYLGKPMGNLGIGGSWESSVSSSTQLTTNIAYDDLGAKLVAGAPFPETIPKDAETNSVYVAFESNNHVTGFALTGHNLPNSYYSAILSHQRMWLQIEPAAAETIQRSYLRVTERCHPGPLPYPWLDCEDPDVTIEKVDVTIPKGKTESSPFDLLCGFNGPGGVPEGHPDRAVQGHTQYLTPVEIAVDADWDGEITFGEKDRTTTEKPYRFWINNDQDDVESDEPIIVEANNRDLLDSTIKTNRDLEDFTRIKISTGLPLKQLREGKFQVGLKIKSPSSNGPAIRVWPNESDTGSLDYLKDGTAAARQRSKTCIGDTQNGTIFFPKAYWQGPSGTRANLIFEGIKKGKGELVLVVKTENSDEVETASIHLDLLDVREMYQRARIVNEAGQIPAPWGDDTPPAQTWEWYPWNWSYSEDPDAKPVTAVMVHGWRLKYMDFMNWSDTSYKRLWHQGFKGKFYSFRWATFSGDNNGIHDRVDEQLEALADIEHSIIPPPGGLTYNDSEYRAWLCGPALANFVNQLPNPGKRHLFAHSMGNVIAGSALRSGMLIDKYAMCNSAMASMAYDHSRVHPANSGYKTPDTDTDLTIRETYGLANKVAGLPKMPKISNFCLRDDTALKGWLTGNAFFKADNFKFYYYEENSGLTQYKLYFNPAPKYIKNVTSVPEAMGYVTQSRSLPAGTDFEAGGSINDGIVSMNSWFGTTHSAQWRWSNQKTHLFWEKLFEKLELKTIE